MITIVRIQLSPLPAIRTRLIKRDEITGFGELRRNQLPAALRPILLSVDDVDEARHAVLAAIARQRRSRASAAIVLAGATPQLAEPTGIMSWGAARGRHSSRPTNQRYSARDPVDYRVEQISGVASAGRFCR